MMMRLSDAGGDQQRGLLKTGDIAKGISEGQQQHLIEEPEIKSLLGLRK